jgi:hypothetical protein
VELGDVMIPIPDGWTVHHGARELLLVHPAGLDVAAIRYRDRLRPLAPVGELVARAVISPFETSRVRPTRRVITHEGEYAALVTIEGTAGDAPAQYDLGFVFHDDHYTQIAALTADASRFEDMTRIVHDLLHDEVFLFGVRPRRALYAPPDGWMGIARGMLTEWYAPDFPRDRALITVWPAMPRQQLPDDWWHDASRPRHGVTRATPPPAEALPIDSAHGLAGEALRVCGGDDTSRIERELAVLQDDRYAYLCRLETIAPAHSNAAATAHRSTFAALIRSIEPIPHPRPDARLVTALEHWAT